MSADIRERLQQTAAAPTRPLDTAAVVGKARRQRRMARVGVASGAAAMVVAAGLVGPVLDGQGQQLEVVDRPGALEQPAGGVELGATYVWRSRAGSAQEAGEAFAAEVLGWPSTEISEPPAGPPDGPTHLVLLGPEDRSVELNLEPVDGGGGWAVIQVEAGLHQPVSVSESPSLWWRPSVPDDRHRTGLFIGERGVAYLYTTERGTVSVPLDDAAVVASEVSLADHIDIGLPFCHNIRSTLLLFWDDTGQIASAVGGVWYRQPPPECDTTAGANTATSGWLTDQPARPNPDPAVDSTEFTAPPEVALDDAPDGTADRLAKAHGLLVERASITRFGADTAVVDVALRDPETDVVVSVLLRQLAAPQPQEVYIEKATEWDYYQADGLEILQAAGENFQRTVAVAPTGLLVNVTIKPPPRQAALPDHHIDALALATEALNEPDLADAALRGPS